MAHFAHITNNIVDSVIVISQETLDASNGWYCPACGVHKPKEEWVQTSYNTRQGKYEKGTTEQEKLSLKMVGSAEDIKARERKHYAGIGYKFDAVNNMFIPPQPYTSWILNKETATWDAPKKKPVSKTGEVYEWSEELLDWVIRK